MEHSDIEHMAQGFPPSNIGKDHEEVVTELAKHALELQQKLDAANKELARYSMSAGQADQFAAEAKAARKALGYAESAEDVAPVDLLEKIAELRAEGVEMFSKHCQKRHGEMMKNEPNDAVSNAAITATRRAGEFALHFASQLRAETDTTPSQYESLAGGK